MSLSDLIAETQEQKQKEQELRQAEMKTELKQLQDATAEAFGPYWPDLSAMVKKVEYNTDSGHVRRVQFICDSEEYGPFTIESQYTGIGRGGVDVKLHHGVGFSGIAVENLGEFLLTRKQKTAADKEEKIKQQENRRQLEISNLIYYLASNFHNQKSNAVNYERLCELAPERKTEWNVLHEKATELSRRAAQQEEEKKAEIIRKEEEHRRFKEERAAVIERNEQRVAPLKEKLNEPFQVWELHYGVKVRGEEGEDDIVGSYSAYVLDEKPVKNKWRALVGGKIVESVFYNPIRLDGPFACAVSERGNCLWIPEIEWNLPYSPLRSEEEVRAMVAKLNLEPIPGGAQEY